MCFISDYVQVSLHEYCFSILIFDEPFYKDIKLHFKYVVMSLSLCLFVSTGFNYIPFTNFCFIVVTAAYKHADGRKIDGRRVLVDVERARTVKGWRPRRLGGGLGGTRKGGPEVNTKYSGRDDNMMNRSRSRSRERGGRARRSVSRGRADRRRRSRSKDRRRRSRSRSGEKCKLWGESILSISHGKYTY